MLRPTMVSVKAFTQVELDVVLGLQAASGCQAYEVSASFGQRVSCWFDTAAAAGSIQQQLDQEGVAPELFQTVLQAGNVLRKSSICAVEN